MSTPPTGDHGRGLRWARELALTAGAVAGLVCIIAAVGALAFGIKPVVFRSGSMSPTISTGALALVRTVPAADISTGDIISVVAADGTRLTHRVVAIDSVTGNTATLRLRGDANAQPDPQPYAVAEADRVLLHVDRLGYVVAWLSSPAALVAAGLLAAVLILTLRPRGRRARPRPRAKPRHRVGAGAALAGGALTVTLVAGQVPGSLASFTSTATATAGPFAASTTFVPRVSTEVTCTTNATPLPAKSTLRWKHAGPAYDYKIILRDLDGVARGEWIVNPPSLATLPAGAAVSQTISGAGLAGHSSIWRYDAEIHTVLRSSGEMSTVWAGYGVYQDAANSKSLRCSGRGPQDETTSPYEFPARPTSLTCETQGVLLLLRTAKLTWEGNAYRYRVLVTERDTGTVVLQQADTASKTTTLGAGLLDLSLLLKPTEFFATVHSVDANGVLSTQALSRPLTTNILGGLTGLGCNPDGRSTEPAAESGSPARLADDAEAFQPSTTPATSATQTTAPTTTPPATTTPATTAPSTTAPTATTAPPETTVEEAELGTPVSSAGGAYEAVIVQTGSGRAAVIRNASGTEVARVPARAGDSLRWVGNQLWITSADGPSYLDGDAGWSLVIPQPGAIPE